MSPSKQVQHFSHIHALTVVTGYGDFTCDGCNTHGYGKTYRCAQCDYDLHDYCATCPSTLLSFKHPQHVLQLVYNVPGHICDICDVSVEGFYYCCKACDFDVHPLCTGRPQQSSHPNHGCGCECGHKVPRRSKRKLMVRILKDITKTVVTNIITSLDSEDFSDWF